LITFETAQPEPASASGDLPRRADAAAARAAGGRAVLVGAASGDATITRPDSAMPRAGLPLSNRCERSGDLRRLADPSSPENRLKLSTTGAMP
jgi:hypothetical protein